MSSESPRRPRRPARSHWLILVLAVVVALAAWSSGIAEALLPAEALQVSPDASNVPPPTDTAIATDTPVLTDTPISTDTPTNVPAPTDTVAPTSTATSAPAATNTPAATATQTSTPVPAAPKFSDGFESAPSPLEQEQRHDRPAARSAIRILRSTGDNVEYSGLRAHLAVGAHQRCLRPGPIQDH